MINKKIKTVDDWIVPLYKVYTDEEDLNLITKIIKRGTKWAIGPEIEEFENTLKKYVGVDYCITLNSGTSALHAIFLAYGFQKNDEIIVPSFSFIATANAVLFVGANPIFADIEEQNLGLNAKSITKKINSKTRGVVPIDYGGLPCKIFDIQKITQDNNLVLIDDAAESLGSSVYGKKVGSIAHSTIFSFCGNKVLTTGEGGAIVTNSKEIFEKVKSIRSHGRVDITSYFDSPDNYHYENIGYNWRMSSMTAALGISQLSKLDKIIKMRRQNANYLSSKLSKHSQIQIPYSSADYENIYQMYSIRLNDKKTRDELHNFLTKKRIFSKIYFNPIHLTSLYMKKFGTKADSLPITENIAKRILTLPLYPNMTKEELDYVVNSISEFFEKE